MAHQKPNYFSNICITLYTDRFQDKFTTAYDK